ncbi:tetratricopeptide repeat protein [Aurantibacter sp.]|uniref:tetratricopeptide repeat protein n=1 Tax=Aurantibacter sp. TaxID=2807103 RepID=UPI0035C85993
MQLKNGIFFLALFITGQLIFAQKTEIYTHQTSAFKKAEALYRDNQFQSAQTLFSQVIETTEDGTIRSNCAFYIANCAVRLNQQNADVLMEAFVEDYPTSTKRNAAYLNVATYYFENGKYAYAEKWFDKVDETGLTNSQHDAFNFAKGYTSFTTKNYKNAQKYLAKVENSQEYGSQAKYYIGFMAYDGDDYDKANTYFNQVGDNDKYAKKLSYYQADLNFKLGKFEKAIELANQQIDKSSDDEVSELNKIIGESYFNLENYNEALPYLKEYKGKNGKWSNTDYYQLGYTYYKEKQFDNAISEFNKIITADNSVAQNAYYHLGESYVSVSKKQEALNAFKIASEMDYDLKIQEDAALNYAKLSYEIGNPYQSVPQVLTTFLGSYPKTNHKEIIEDLLIDSYITSKNYPEALKILKGKNSFENKKAFQKVALYRGLELYNENKYTEAKDLFQKSLKENIEALYSARATFWIAETDYNLTDFEEALIGFKQFKGFKEANQTPEYSNLNYNLAYTYFKLKNYTKSAEHFNLYVNSIPEDLSRLNDAYLRLADGYFVTSQYSNAISSYEYAIKVGVLEKDYATFQKAMSYGYLGENKTKISELEAFISTYKTSNLLDDALYTLGNAYINENKTPKAMQVYDTLVNNQKQSPLVSKALLRQGLTYYNKSENQIALTKFKLIAKDFPNTAEANQAVSTARLIYIDLGKVNEYAAWVKTLDYVKVTDVDIDNATYQSAEKQFLDNNKKEALKQFNVYLSQFSKGLHALEAHFYLAQLYYKDNLTENAAPHFEAVINASRSEFTEESLLRLSQINLEAKNWKKAIPILKRLEAEANFAQNILFAQSNIMKAFYELEDYVNAEVYANKVLVNPSIGDTIKNDAKIIIARSAIKTGDKEKAQSAYAEVQKTAAGETAAEALYYDAYFKNKAKNYEASNVATQKLAAEYSSYKFYGAKGLIVMAKNFNALGDAFQATYILESVIKNFSAFPEVVEEAQIILKEIKEEEAKTNSSVIPED